MPEQDMAFQANKGKGHPELSGAEKYGKTEKGNVYEGRKSCEQPSEEDEVRAKEK